MPKKLLALLLLIIAGFALSDLSRSARAQLELAFGEFAVEPDAPQPIVQDLPKETLAPARVADTLPTDIAGVASSTLTATTRR